MKTTWEPDDVIPGRIVCKPLQKGERSFKPSGWTAKWTFKIGFVNGGGADSNVLVCLSDGMVGHAHTAADLAATLNKEGLILMPHAWLIDTMRFLRDAF